MATWFLLCRPAELEDKLDLGIEIYKLGAEEFVGLAQSQQKEDLTAVAIARKFKAMKIAKIEFDDPNNFTAKGRYKFVCWEVI